MNVIILGGGFGGLYAALALDKALAHEKDIEVTLINKDNFFLFTPMLHEVAASDLDMTTIINPVRKMLKRVKFITGEVQKLDFSSKRIVISHGFDGHGHELAYDHLVVSLGSITNFFNTPGLEENALTMKTLGDAIGLRNRLIANLEEADTECAARFREPLLTFVVAGGGFAGVETIAAINDFLRDSIYHYSNLKEAMLNVILVHPGDVILPELGEKLGEYTQKKLLERKVDIRLKTKVTGMANQEVTLSDGTKIKANTLIWTAGTSPNPILETLPCKKERGRVLVNEFLEVPEWPGVWALGDCALVPDALNKTFHPPTAQHACREGKIVAKNILATIHGTSKTKFSFTTLGQLASIGKRSGVANVMGINFSGFIAWWLWRSIYLSKLPRFEKKFRAILDWTLDLFFSKDFVQVMTFRAKTISQKEKDEPVIAKFAILSIWNPL